MSASRRNLRNPRSEQFKSVSKEMPYWEPSRTLIFSFALRREQFVLDESTRIEKAKATTVIGL